MLTRDIQACIINITLVTRASREVVTKSERSGVKRSFKVLYFSPHTFRPHSNFDFTLNFFPVPRGFGTYSTMYLQWGLTCQNTFSVHNICSSFVHSESAWSI